MSNYFTAITIGIGCGMLLTVAGNKLSSAHARESCKSHTETHEVVFVSSFVGDTYACVDKRWL